jgi:hypothetical protein
MSTDDELFTPEEVLGDFSAKRARLLLFQIESRTCTGYLEYMFSNVTFCASLGTPIGYGGYINQPLQAHLGPVSVILRSREAFSSRSEVYPSSSVGISAISPRHEAASTSGFETPQAETFGNGQESTSHAVHRRWVLPAAIAGVRWR